MNASSILALILGEYEKKLIMEFDDCRKSFPENKTERVFPLLLESKPRTI